MVQNYKNKYLKYKLKYEKLIAGNKLQNIKQKGGIVSLSSINKERELLDKLYNMFYVNFPQRIFNIPWKDEILSDNLAEIIMKNLSIFLIDRFQSNAFYIVEKGQGFCRSINDDKTKKVKDRWRRDQHTNKSPVDAHTNNQITFCNANPRGNWAIPLDSGKPTTHMAELWVPVSTKSRHLRSQIVKSRFRIANLRWAIAWR